MNNNNSKDAYKVDIKSSTLPPCRELGFGNTEEDKFYVNMSQMVREDGEGSDGHEVRDCTENENESESCQLDQTETSFPINDMPPSARTRVDSVLYEKADREGQMINLINSSSDGWVYVNSGQKNKSLPADVHRPRETKREDMETVVLYKNNNSDGVTRQKPNTREQASQEKVSEINEDMEQMHKTCRNWMRGGKDVCTAVDEKRDKNDQNYVNLSDNESETEVPYVNVGEGAMQTESHYIDMMSQDLIDDEYVDMTPVTSKLSAENAAGQEYCNLYKEREKDSRELENSGLHEVFKPLYADENIHRRHGHVTDGNDLPVTPRPAPRRRSNRPSDSSAENQNPPRPTPRVRTKWTKSLPRQSPVGAAFVNPPSPNSHSELCDQRDNRCVTSGDERGVPSCSSPQSSKSLDTSLTELPLSDDDGHARVTSPPPPDSTKSHNYEKNLEDILPDVPPKYVTSATIKTRKPPQLPPKSHNYDIDAFGNFEDLPNVSSDAMLTEPIEKQTPPPRPPKSHNQECDTYGYLKIMPDIPSDDMVSEPISAHSPPSRPTKLHQFMHNTDQTTTYTTITSETKREGGDHNLISSSPPPLPPGPFKANDGSLLPLDSPLPKPLYQLSSSPPRPPKSNKAIYKKDKATPDQLNFHPRDQDEDCRPPKLFPRKSIQELNKPQPVSVSSSSKKDKVLTKPQVNTAGEITMRAQSPPPRPPKTFVQRISGVSSRWGYDVPVLPTVASPPLSTLPHTAPAPSSARTRTGLTGGKSEPVPPMDKLGFGIRLEEGPWYVCNDVTRQSFLDSLPDASYEYIDDWDVPEKLPEESPSSQSTATNNRTVTTEHYKSCQYQNVPGTRQARVAEIRMVESPDTGSDTGYDYEEVEDWDVQEKLPKESPGSQSAATSNQTVTTEHYKPCQYQNVPGASHAGISQTGTRDLSKAPGQNGAATSSARNEYKNVPTAHIKTKQKQQGKKSDKIDMCGKSPKKYKETAKKIMTQIEQSSKSRDEDFEDMELIQLYLIAKESLKD